MFLCNAPVRIVCVGNRMVAGDDLGPRVHDHLAANALPDGLAVIDGGLQGLNLLGILDGAQRVVFVDALAGVRPGRAQRVARRRVLANGGAHFDHGAGLGYLVRAMQVGCDEPPRAWSLVGAAGAASPDVIGAVANLALLEAARPVRAAAAARA